MVVGHESQPSGTVAGFLTLCPIIPTIICNMHLQSNSLIYFPLCFIRIYIYSMSMTSCKTCPPILHSIVHCITAELIIVAIAELHVLRPESGRSLPVDHNSLWSLAAMLIPCTTFKRIPFALQFVRPGIITTPHNSLNSPSLRGQSYPWPFSAPSKG